MTTDFNSSEKTENFRTIQMRWADMDANRHLRHSAYYDFAAAMRMMYLTDQGLTLKRLGELEIGIILFREEAIFKREITLEDTLRVEIAVLKSTSDFSRWSIRHNFVKGDGTLAAVLTVDGAWMDLIKRKLATPPVEAQAILNNFPKAAEYQLIPAK